MPVLRLNEISPLVRELPPEWRSNTVATGYWLLPAAEEWVVPSELQEFLDDGPPPFFASMGSAVTFPAALGNIVVEAAHSAGVRLVLGAGWHRKGGLDTTDLPSDVIAVGEVPHDRLFPLMTGVIHHGGGGSTATAFRAGVPAVALPVFADQPYWGRRIADLGVGPKPLPARKVTVEQLASAMRQMRDDMPMRRRAAQLGSSLRAEDGVAVAVKEIGRLLESRGMSS
jgi:sterol 3beta-glucosyltransferase